MRWLNAHETTGKGTSLALILFSCVSTVSLAGPDKKCNGDAPVHRCPGNDEFTSPLPLEPPTAFTATFYDAPVHQQQWRALVGRIGESGLAGQMAEVLRDIELRSHIFPRFENFRGVSDCIPQTGRSTAPPIHQKAAIGRTAKARECLACERVTIEQAAFDRNSRLT